MPAPRPADANPYESPKEAGSSGWLDRWEGKMRYAVSALIGAAFGYLACTIAANMEQYHFHAIRQWVTGKTAMSDIIDHPSDQWIGPSLVTIFVITGASLGLVIAWWRQPKQSDGTDAPRDDQESMEPKNSPLEGLVFQPPTE